MMVPESVTFLVERLSTELCDMEGERPHVVTHIRHHSDPTQGWVVEVNIEPPHAAMLPLLPTVQRLGYGSAAWDLDRNAIIITGVVNNIPVSFFITRVTEATVRPSQN